MSSAITTTPLSEPGVTTLNLKEKEDDKGPPATFEVPLSSATPKDLRFWLIIVSLLISTLLSALDSSGTQGLMYFHAPVNLTEAKNVFVIFAAISTALPTIAKALDSGDFAW